MSIESIFQAKLIIELRHLFPGCIILKNDPNYLQGFPDLLILFKSRYAVLECKASKDSDQQPNQDYYISQLNDWTYASFIYPENKEEVLHDLQQTFRFTR